MNAFTYKHFIILLLAMGFFSFLFGQDLSLYEKRIYLDANGDTLNYRILYPKNYDRTKQYPLILFLHGAGERGYDNEAQLTHGAKLFLQAENRKKYPAIVVLPQCKPAPDYWAHMVLNEQNGLRYREFPLKEAPNPSMKRVMELLAKLQNEEAIDQNRLYIMGLSMGGMGTFELLSRLPNTFAAAVPICGGGNVSQAVKYAKTTSLWIFHGGKDDVVLPLYSQQMYEALKAAGADVQYTLFPDANHNSWDPTFKQKGLLAWLFSKKLKN